MTPAAATVSDAPAGSLAPAFGIYVHVPFCTSRCPYCDFNTYVGLEHTAAEYLGAVLREAEMWAGTHTFPSAGSVFVGGGTPSLVEPALLAEFLRRLGGVLAIEESAEITLEANPESTEADRLSVLRAAGFNRISLGAQSFDPEVLQLLGRAHDAAAVARAVHAARSAGFENLNLDLIYGTPGERDAGWERSLAETIALGPDHVSCYALTIESATRFGADVASGRMPAPDEDVQAERYEHALDALAAAGYRHYELSNWGEPSRHNLVYWTQGDYVGLGAGAHSHVAGVRSWNRKLPAAYAADPERAREGEERLDAAERAREWVILRLRLVEGLDLSEAGGRLGRDLHAEVAGLESGGLVRLEGERMTLTRRGLLLESEVALRLTA